MNPIFGTPDSLPYEAVVPAQWQLVFTLLFGLVAFAAFVYAVYLYAREMDITPILIMMGAAIATYEEPIVDLLAKCWWPTIGQWTAIEAFGRPIPWLCVFAYMAYYGGGVILLSRLFRSGISSKQFMRVFYIAILANIVMEPIPLNLGLWVYYGSQPFTVFGYPLFWPVNNALAAMMTATLVYKLGPYLTELSKLLIIPLILTGNMISNAAVMWPLWTALNMPYGYAVTYPAAILTFLLCGVTAVALSRIVARSELPEKQASPEPKAAINL